MSDGQVLRAPLEIGFDYTRSLGPVLSRFMAGLADRRVLGARAADGTVHAPPFEYDPVTHQPSAPDELVEVGPEGAVVTWSWMPGPLEGQPLPHPFAWALVRLDGADTAMLHAVDAGSPGNMRTGMRVRARWAAERTGSIRDIVCFDPASEPKGAALPGLRSEATREGDASKRPEASERISSGMLVTPIQLHYEHTASPGEAVYLRGLAEGRLVGQKCPVCRKVYIPARGTCPTDGVPITEHVDLPDTGTVTTFAIVNVPYQGQKVAPPYVAAAVLLDGADIAFQALILGCDANEVRMGMRVRAVWKPRDQWGITTGNIDHFEPTGEPDAPYESYAGHL
ncbi:MAG TPA: OB-fold domain-containing protein [Streptosporangiaceae bacterium]